jgi:hypothetical protein
MGKLIKLLWNADEYINGQTSSWNGGLLTLINTRKEHNMLIIRKKNYCVAVDLWSRESEELLI